MASKPLMTGYIVLRPDGLVDDYRVRHSRQSCMDWSPWSSITNDLTLRDQFFACHECFQCDEWNGLDHECRDGAYGTSGCAGACSMFTSEAYRAFAKKELAKWQILEAKGWKIVKVEVREI